MTRPGSPALAQALFPDPGSGLGARILDLVLGSGLGARILDLDLGFRTLDPGFWNMTELTRLIIATNIHFKD